MLFFPAQAQVLQRRPGEVYVHYVNTDKRMDEWIPESACKEVTEVKKRKRGRPRRIVESESLSPTIQLVPGPSTSPVVDGVLPIEHAAMTEEEYDIQHHKQITAKRN